MSCSINPPKRGILTKVFSTFGPNLVALAGTGDELSRGQAQNGVNFDFGVKLDFEGQCQSPPKTIGILTKVFCSSGLNLVILAWTGDELSCGQTWRRTDWRTDGQTQATTIPEGQYWPRVKTDDVLCQITPAKSLQIRENLNVKLILAFIVIIRKCRKLKYIPCKIHETFNRK